MALNVTCDQCGQRNSIRIIDNGLSGFLDYHPCQRCSSDLREQEGQKSFIRYFEELSRSLENMSEDDPLITKILDSQRGKDE